MPDWGADDERTRRLVGIAPEAAPSPEARGRARAAFLTGDPAGAVPGLAGSDLTGSGLAGSGRIGTLRRGFPWIPASVAAAAALAALAWFGTQPVEHWRMVGEHEMRLGDTLVLRVDPGSNVSLPDPPGRWFGRSCELRLETGSVFASSGGRPLGFDLVVTTEDASTRITGTTFAVRRNELGTCICLYEGSVEVEQHVRGEVVRVPTGQRVQVYSDGGFPGVEPLDEDEIRVLRELSEAI